MNYTDKQIEDLINDIYNGKVTQTELPEELYNAIGKHLENGLYKGFGASLADIDFNSKDYALLSELRDNIYMFSGAKTYQEVRAMSDMVADSGTFSDFKGKAMEVYDTYNKTWLEAEYNTAVGQAQQAVQWSAIERDKADFPYLTYSAVIDDHTSEICEPLNGVTLPVDDPLWNEYTPLNHFNCRCTLEQIDKFTDVTQTPKEDVDRIVNGDEENKGLKDTVADTFKMNSGKDGYVFSDEHPYFQVEPKDRDLARENFGLPIPEPQIPEQPKEQIEIKNRTQAKDILKELIERQSSIKVKNIAIAQDLELAGIKTRVNVLNDLLGEYKISEIPNKVPTSIEMRSSKTSYGSVARYNSGGLHSINVGHTSDGSGSRLFDATQRIERAKSRVDLANLDKATATHEFAHVIGVEFESRLSTAPEYLKDFFKELETTQKDYLKELREFGALRNFEKVNEISLGKYARTNINEFMAEGFTEYKLSSTPSPYATKIGKLIDKYFKK